ncbi:MAG TPA: hypothetical protein PK957_04260 [Candidatus Dojkabacteria bacterium]|nr:hypothetical protein [Candidatus Dojkabacteria bacterium]
MSSVPEWDFGEFSDLVFLSEFPEDVRNGITELWNGMSVPNTLDLYPLPYILNEEEFNKLSYHEIYSIVLQRFAWTIAAQKIFGEYCIDLGIENYEEIL